MDVNGNDNTPEWGYCQVAGCMNDAIPCYISGGPPDDPDDLLCADHCQENGYCWGCGVLWAGSETFDFSPRGLCGECIHQFRIDEDAGDDEPAEWDQRWVFGPYSKFSERTAP